MTEQDTTMPGELGKAIGAPARNSRKLTADRDRWTHNGKFRAVIGIALACME